MYPSLSSLEVLSITSNNIHHLRYTEISIPSGPRFSHHHCCLQHRGHRGLQSINNTQPEPQQHQVHHQRIRGEQRNQQSAKLRSKPQPSAGYSSSRSVTRPVTGAFVQLRLPWIFENFYSKNPSISVFSTFPSLEYLNLSSNALHTVSQSSFLLPSLSSLDMSHNNLFEASYFMFDTSPKLKNIYFSNNSISILEGKMRFVVACYWQGIFWL